MARARIEWWSEEDFFSKREDWDALLARSQADPLFMSWQWQRTWWRRHAPLLNGELVLLAVHAPDGRLCGLVPLYAHVRRTARVFNCRRLELIGNAWRSPDVVFSEYLDLIASRGDEQLVLGAAFEWLAGSRAWDEIVFAFVREDSLARRLAERLRSVAFVRRTDALDSSRVELPPHFEAVVAALSSNTRRKLWHQRTKQPIEWVQLSHGAIVPALERLEALVSRRWQMRQNTARQGFHVDIAQLHAARGTLRLSELRLSGETISVMLNLRAGDTEYYLQSGFDTGRAPGISPGYLHLGYAMEAACQDGLRSFDLLGGHGRHRDYKRDFPATHLPLACHHVVRNLGLRMLYQLRDLVS